MNAAITVWKLGRPETIQATASSLHSGNGDPEAAVPGPPKAGGLRQNSHGAYTSGTGGLRGARPQCPWHVSREEARVPVILAPTEATPKFLLIPPTKVPLPLSAPHECLGICSRRRPRETDSSPHTENPWEMGSDGTGWRGINPQFPHSLQERAGDQATQWETS